MGVGVEGGMGVNESFKDRKQMETWGQGMPVQIVVRLLDWSVTLSLYICDHFLFYLCYGLYCTLEGINSFLFLFLILFLNQRTIFRMIIFCF